MKFIALCGFSSKEMKSFYIEGGEYTIREGNKKLAEMVSKWTKAKRFKVISEVPSVFDMKLDVGSVSYVLPDDEFEVIVSRWLEQGKVELIDGPLVAYSLQNQSGGIDGNAEKIINSGVK